MASVAQADALEKGITRLVGACVLTDAAWGIVGRRLGLSGRELEIVRGVFDDKIELAMAADLGIAPRTVHSHLERLYHKLDINSRAQLVLRVMQESLTLMAAGPPGGTPQICAGPGVGYLPLRLREQADVSAPSRGGKGSKRGCALLPKRARRSLEPRARVSKRPCADP